MPEFASGTTVTPPTPSDPPFTWEVAKPHLKFHQVTEEQLSMLESGYSSSKLALCTAAGSAALTCLSVLVTVRLDDLRTLMFFVALLILAIFTIAFGADAYRERRSATELANRIRGAARKG